MSELYNKYKNIRNQSLYSCFLSACKEGLLDDVKYLLTSNDIKEKIDINYDNDRALVAACSGGHLEVVKYLLTSPDLKKHADIKGDNYYCLTTACSNCHLHIIKYLLTSPDLKEHADIHVYNDEPFKIVMEENVIEILHYFIFDLNITKTKHIERNLKLYPNDNIEKMFMVRELNKSLNNELDNELDNNEVKNKKIKI